LETKKKKKRKSEIRKKKENEEGKSFWRNGGRKARAGRTRTAPSFKCINGKKGVAAAYLKRMMAWWRGGGAEGRRGTRTAALQSSLEAADTQTKHKIVKRGPKEIGSVKRLEFQGALNEQETRMKPGGFFGLSSSSRPRKALALLS
jgi:hypothetical protein